MSLILRSVFPENHIDCIWCVKYHPNKKIFASCGSDARIIIWEYSKEKSDYQKISTLENTHKSTIRYIDWDNSGNYLSAASFDNNVSIYKMKEENENYSFALVDILESNDSEIKSVSWSKNGNLISFCSRKGNIHVYQKDVDDFGSEEFSCISINEGHKGDIKMVKFSPCDDTLFSCGFDESFKIWERDNSKDDFVLVNNIKEHSGTVWCIEFNKNGNIFFTCSDDKKLIMWGIGEKNFNNTEKILDYENIVKLAKIQDLHSRPIYSCSLNYNENYIFTCSNDGNIGIIKIIVNNDNKNNKYEMKLLNMIKDAHEQFSVNCICTNKNEIISCGDDCNIKIWKFEEKE